MIRLVIAGIIVYVVYRLSRFMFTPPEKISKNRSGEQSRVEGEDLVKDPYCGTYVPINSAYKTAKDGRTLYFCSKECLEKYKKENG
ncbi:MAG: YHS domain-containing protein [Deltaproteobacteria bacterium]|nr:YHS domain-containing protein [Deltaproteobacteria bacterium]